MDNPIEEATKMVRFKIMGRIPSKKNSLRRIMRGGRIFTVPSEEYEQWNILTQQELRKQARVYKKLHTFPIKKAQFIDVIITFPDNRRADLHNKWESIADTLVDVGILGDDKWQVTGDINLKSNGVDKDNAGVVILIFY